MENAFVSYSPHLSIKFPSILYSALRIIGKKAKFINLYAFLRFHENFQQDKVELRFLVNFQQESVVMVTFLGLYNENNI